MTVQASSAATVAQRLRVLAQLYQQGQASEFMDRTLNKLLAHEADLCREQLNELQEDLAEFEERYGLPSDEFYRRYQAGQTDDRMDYVEWASLVQMRNNLQERLQILSGEA
jgi:alpha-amylase/alpha-mannosidase (GH57 family)